MQTFLPFPDFHRSAASLDEKRLYKQIIECKQILSVLNGKTIGWKNHPAVKMWRGYELALKNYMIACFREWYKRRWASSMGSLGLVGYPDAENPLWIGTEEFHRSHRSNLKRKDYDHYAPLFETDLPDDLPYVWPSEAKQ